MPHSRDDKGVEMIEYKFLQYLSQISTLEKQLKLNDPKLKQKEGWAEIVLDGKRIKLSSIKRGDRFMLVDIKKSIKVEAL